MEATDPDGRSHAMTTVHPRKPVRLFGFLALAFASLAAGISGQSRSALDSSVADAMTEALRGPFHDTLSPSVLLGRPLPLPSASGRVDSPPGRVEGAALPVLRTPVAGIPADEEKPRHGKVFLLTTLVVAAGHAGAYYWADLCGLDVVNARSGILPATTKPRVVCPTRDEEVLAISGHLATIALAGGAAALVGRGFWKSLAGSALGFAGGLVAGVGFARMAGEDSSWASGVGGGIWILGHAAIATLFSG